MKSKTRIGIVIISICFVLQIGITNSHSQGTEFIIKLKSGVEIKTKSILIEDGIVYYIFSSYGKKKVGIGKDAIQKIFERKRSGDLRPINIPLPPKTYAKGQFEKQKDHNKGPRIQKHQTDGGKRSKTKLLSK